MSALTADATRPDETSAPPSIVPLAAPSVMPRAGFGRRVVRLLLSPLRYARRRPLRALGYLAFALLVSAAVAGAAAYAWFAHHLRNARTELARGHNAPALRRLEKCRMIRPEAREVLILSARVARRAGSWNEAEFFLDRYTHLYGEREESVFERLLLRATRGEIEDASPALVARMRAEGPEADMAREALITGLLNRFRWPEASHYLTAWLEAAPDSTMALLLQGKLNEQRQAVGPALDGYRRIVELDPEHDEARLRLTTLLLGNRFGEEALTHLVVLRQRLPENLEIEVQWGRALALQARTAESRAALEACVARHPDYPPALAELGSQSLADGDEEKAERLLARAVALEPGNVTARSQYAFVLARNGKREEAAREQKRVADLKADFERIAVLISGPLQERPNDPQVPYEIAQIAVRSGQVREALRWFTAALRLDAAHAPTHQALARLYRALDNPVMAARHRALAHGRDAGNAKQ